jgi:DNA sulfur modification protein DndD
MILSNIKITNFRQYEFVDLDLNYEKAKNITTIVGVNGAGKSNFFGSIIWCLYGKEPDAKDNRQKNSEFDYVGILHEPSFVKSNIDKIIETKVELTFNDINNLESYKITRSHSFKKVSNGRHEVFSENYSVSEKKEVGGWSVLEQDEAAAFLLRFIPEAVSSFYFFDGEKLDDFFTKAGDELKKQISKIAQLDDLVMLTKSRLPNLKTDFKSKDSDGDEIQTLRTKISRQENDLETNQDKIDRYDNSISDSTNHLNSANDFLEKYDDIKISNKSKEISQIEEDLKILISSKNDYMHQKFDLIHESLPFLASNGFISDFRKEVEHLYETNQIPPAIDIDYLQQMLDDCKCICGRPLEEETGYRDNVEVLKERDYELGEMGKSIMQADIRLKNSLELALKFPEKIKKINSSESKIETSISEKRKKVSELKEMIKDIDIEQVNSMISIKEECENSINIDKPKRDKLIGLNNGIKMSLRDDKKRLDNMERKNIIDENKKLRFDIINDAISLLKEAEDETILEMKESISQSTNDNFLNIIGNNEFEKVVVGNDYSVNVKRNDGRYADKLSAGQTQILAFSFIEALNTKAGLSMPIIIDTPLGRISSENKVKIADSISRLLKGRQIILLFTDSELSDNVKNTLHSSTINNYSLIKNESCTEIKM